MRHIQTALCDVMVSKVYCNRWIFYVGYTYSVVYLIVNCHFGVARGGNLDLVC